MDPGERLRGEPPSPERWHPKLTNTLDTLDPYLNAGKPVDSEKVNKGSVHKNE